MADVNAAVTLHNVGVDRDSLWSGSELFGEGIAMKLEVLALDYDGTISEDGTVHPEVRTAIQRARARGIIVTLVTGRILEDLHRVAGDLRFVDAIVAENGAVLVFPDNGRSVVLGSPPPPEFAAEIRRRGIDVTTGECVVEVDATSASDVLAIVRDLELPLALLFNRGRLMILPQGISKATGLRALLGAMRLSEHNAVAIGDAENDHALLNVCEVGVAVGWGSPALKAVADIVLEGTGPDAVARYIENLADTPWLIHPRIGRRHLALGYTANDHLVSLAVRGRNVLVVGDPRSGKSWIAGLLAEQLILQRYCVCVIDPEGDYLSLESLPGVIVLGGDDPPPRPRDIARALRHPDTSIVIDLSKVKHQEKTEYIASLLGQLAALRRQTGLPHQIVIDEAHYFLGQPNGSALFDFEFAGYTLVTYRVSQLHPDIRNASDVLIATRLTDPVEAQTLIAMAGADAESDRWRDSLANLTIQEAALLRSAEQVSTEPYHLRLAPRFTLHVRHRKKYLSVAVAERDAFVFTFGGTPTGQRARTLQGFVNAVGHCPPEVLDGHLRRGDFSHWVADVFADYPLAAQLRRLEHLYRLRQLLDVRDAIAQAVADRYILAEEPITGGGEVAHRNGSLKVLR